MIIKLMREFRIILSGILIIVGCQNIIAQKSKILQDHYTNEFQSFKEFAVKNSSSKGDTNIDVRFYHLDLNIEIDYPYIRGNVRCIFEPVTDNLNSVKFDLNSAYMVDSISEPCESFYQDGDNIYITLNKEYIIGEPVDINIYYQGIPALAGGYKGLRYESHGENEPVIASLSTPYLAHYWYPCKDGPEDKADSVYTDITIADTVINGVEVIALSNGLLENEIDNGSTKTFQWRHRYPIVTYYVMVAISNYVHFQHNFSGTDGTFFPLDYYVFEDNLSSAEEGVAEIPDVMQFFTEIFGPYPFSNEKYGMTQLGYYGAIENQTNTIINNMNLSWFYVSVHELGHMWFADMITCTDWHHGWLNEGFATYSEALWDEHANGIEAYKANMEDNEYFNGGTLYLNNPQDTFNTFPGIIYQKGAYIMHMLRGVLGDDQFFDAIYDYATHPDFVYANASTEDMQQVFENTSGIDLDFFFDQWVYDEYHPVYMYNYSQNPENNINVSIYQAQEELLDYRPVFEMPIPLRFIFDDDSDTLIIVWNDQQLQPYSFNFSKNVSSMELDPDKWVLRKAFFDPGLPVGIVPQNFYHGPEIYPNPVSESVNIRFPEDLNYSWVELADGKGRTIYKVKSKGQNQVNVDCSNIPAGNYIIKFIGEKGNFTRKIIKL